MQSYKNGLKNLNFKFVLLEIGQLSNKYLFSYNGIFQILMNAVWDHMTVCKIVKIHQARIHATAAKDMNQAQMVLYAKVSIESVYMWCPGMHN